MVPLRRVPLLTADKDISLEQTAISDDGHLSAPPARSRARIAFEETRIGQSTAGDEAAGSRPPADDIGLLETHHSESPRGDKPMPRLADSGDELRMKALIKGKLFRGRSAPIKIGRFTVLDRLGEGGMGVVYTAYDDKLDRKVAVKVLRGEATREDDTSRQRLMREAQAMARLSHPNIVTVHEVGDYEDQVFVAMEFVRGMSLDAWMRRRERSWREVLAVFVQAGRGLQAAHAAGIIHRDFKPHNVLVGDDGAVKVLDFGLARAAGYADSDELAITAKRSESAGHALMVPLTQTGAIMGTPAYMAPEQHEGRPASAASDQFAFCISLYEGVYKRHPFSTDSLASLIGDAILGRVAPPPAGAKVPARIFRALQRGLSVAVDRRFASMAELLAELERDPEARRRRLFASTAFAGFVGVAGFGAAALQQPAAAAPICSGAADELAAVWSGERSEAVRSAMSATGVPYAADTWSKVQPQLEAYASAWIAMRGEACATHASGHQSDHLFDLRTACLDQRRAGFAGLVDTLASADAEVMEKAMQAVSTLPPIERCGDVAALTADVVPPDDARARVRVQAVRETLARAAVQEHAGRYHAGLATIAAVSEEAQAIDYPPLRGELMLREGSLQMEAGDFSAADASFGQALWTALAADDARTAAQAASKRMFLRAARMNQPAEALRDLELAQALHVRVRDDVELSAEFENNLGAVYMMAGDYAAARQHMLAAVAARTAAGRHDTVLNAYTYNNLGFLAAFLGNATDAANYYGSALPLGERLLGPGHPTVHVVRGNLGAALQLKNHLSEGTSLLQATVAALGEAQATATPPYAAARTRLGFIALKLRDLPRAHAELTAGRAAFTAIDPDETSAREAIYGLGDEAAARASFADAQAIYEGIVDRVERRFGADHPEALLARMRFGEMWLEYADRPLAALPQFDRVAATCSDAAPETAVLCGDAARMTADAKLRLGLVAEASDPLQRALALYERIQGESSPEIVATLRLLGEAALAQGRRDEAVSHLRRAAALALADFDPDHPDLARTQFSLAKALAADPAAAAEARALADAALAIYKGRGEAFAPEIRAIEGWQSTHSP
ncbi:Serine/threonine protein kinase [Nannocystis exedens]|uniref:Serine/threonine protein kinase n=1 Tax=Nannocystis exedens TaxID=54 RepID=A0A1I2HS82_9BACT|nr:serine/threonine-protein kinase [Nannocystis exedens]PCC69885.1 serine/threonine protein kinase [Nannocystis exedens]SFF32769.1 Serine/threonine protein kinase [Nannocystis exedens]